MLCPKARNKKLSTMHSWFSTPKGIIFDLNVRYVGEFSATGRLLDTSDGHLRSKKNVLNMYPGKQVAC